MDLARIAYMNALDMMEAYHRLVVWTLSYFIVASVFFKKVILSVFRSITIKVYVFSNQCKHFTGGTDPQF